MSKLPQFLYKNSYPFGILLALVIPIVSAIPIFPIINICKGLGWVDVHFPISKYLLLCCIPNFIIFRQYIKSLDLEKTGKALFVTSIVEVVVLLLLSNRSIF